MSQEAKKAQKIEEYEKKLNKMKRMNPYSTISKSLERGAKKNKGRNIENIRDQLMYGSVENKKLKDPNNKEIPYKLGSAYEASIFSSEESQE